jgi:hypothetical protein
MQKFLKPFVILVVVVGLLAGAGLAGFMILRKVTLAIPPKSIPTTGATPAVSGKFTAAELAAHNTASDCYIAYQNEVFNITWYIPRHEGGDVIIQECGQVTDDFSKIHEGGPFTKRAIQAVLQASKVGTLDVVN